MRGSGGERRFEAAEDGEKGRERRGLKRGLGNRPSLAPAIKKDPEQASKSQKSSSQLAHPGML